MKRVLLTGMSGTGKSTVIDKLAEGGYRAVDTDYPRHPAHTSIMTSLPDPPDHALSYARL